MMLILVGPSATGKSEIVKCLVSEECALVNYDKKRRNR